MLFDGLGASFRFPHAVAAAGSGSGIRFGPPAGNCRRVLRRVKGWVLAMLASLRVAPVPLRAFDAPCAPGGPERRSAPRNGPFSLTKELSIFHDHHSANFESTHHLCAPRSRLTHAPAPVLPPLIGVLRFTSPLQPLETSRWRGLPTPVSPKTTHTTTRRPQIDVQTDT